MRYVTFITMSQKQKISDNYLLEDDLKLKYFIIEYLR